jgi:hypothetical protein
MPRLLEFLFFASNNQNLYWQRMRRRNKEIKKKDRITKEGRKERTTEYRE